MNIEIYEQFLHNRTESDEYWALRNELNDFREKMGVLYVYTVEVNNEGDIVLLIDGQPEDSEVASEIGEVMEPVDLSPIEKGEPVSTSIIDDPDNGQYVSAYAPIKDTQGNIVGALGVDIAADQLGAITNEVVSDTFPIVTIISSANLVLFNIVVILFVRVMIRPLYRLEEAAKLMEQGDLVGAEKSLKQKSI